MATKTRHSFIPAADGDFTAFATNYVHQISEHADAYQLSDARIQQLVADLQAWQKDYEQSVAARDAFKAAVEVKDEARKALEDQIRSSARIIQADDEVSNAARDKAGLPIHKTSKTPIQAPTTHPVGSVIGTDRQELTLQFSDQKTPTRRARPYGVTGCEIYVAVGETAPTDPAEFRFVKLATRSRETLTFSAEDGSQTAHVLLRWINTKGQTGPWSPVISGTIPAV